MQRSKALTCLVWCLVAIITNDHWASSRTSYRIQAEATRLTRRSQENDLNDTDAPKSGTYRARARLNSNSPDRSSYYATNVWPGRLAGATTISRSFRHSRRPNKEFTWNAHNLSKRRCLAAVAVRRGARPRRSAANGDVRRRVGDEKRELTELAALASADKIDIRKCLTTLVNTSQQCQHNRPSQLADSTWT